jgi:hypothetical protein
LPSSRNQFNENLDTTAESLTFVSFSDFLLGLLAGSVSGGGNAALMYNAFLEPSVATVLNTGLRSASIHFSAASG